MGSEKGKEGDIIPLPKDFRDGDINLEECLGVISLNEAELRKRKRDVDDVRNEPIHVTFFVLMLVVFGHRLGFSFEILVCLLILPVLNIVHSWIKLAEIETDIVYLEAGLGSIRR